MFAFTQQKHFHPYPHPPPKSKQKSKQKCKQFARQIATSLWACRLHGGATSPAVFWSSKTVSATKIGSSCTGPGLFHFQRQGSSWRHPAFGQLPSWATILFPISKLSHFACCCFSVCFTYIAKLICEGRTSTFTYPSPPVFFLMIVHTRKVVHIFACVYGFGRSTERDRGTFE